MADGKKDKVVEAAFGTFLRYGYRRVTMGDIAEAAGMSRPALYLVFPGKEQIFNAVVRDFGTKALEIRAGVAGLDSVADKLQLTFEVWTVRPFELLHDVPDAKDLTDCSFGFAREAVEAGYRGFENALVAIIEPHADALERRSIAPRQIAHVLALSARGFKEGAHDVDELRALIAGLIAMTLAALDIS